MAVKDYSTNPDENTTISGINIAEGCPPSGINNAIRQLMADVKTEKEERDTAQATKDAAQDAAISAAQTAAKGADTKADVAQSSADAKLPMDGSGVMSGTIVTNTGYALRREGNNGNLLIAGGEFDNSAMLCLDGGAATNPKRWYLRSGENYLIGTNDGSVSLNGYQLHGNHGTYGDSNYYHIYDNGLIEQGGFGTTSSSGDSIVVLPTPFKRGYYELLLSLAPDTYPGDLFHSITLFSYAKNTTSFYVRCFNGNGTQLSINFSWHVAGF